MDRMKTGKPDTNLKNRSYSFSVSIVKFIDNLDQKKTSVQVIIRQLLRSATSIAANIAEAQAASSKKDFINFYHYALKSAHETKFWLRLLIDTGKSQNNQINELLQEVTELLKMISSAILTLKANS
ncbi:MAG: four helix bundle protein [Candidatus Doudnabacteria bacterium]|nr:four helix bundle protein [Candidatus Doudnabacteria bacterium]